MIEIKYHAYGKSHVEYNAIKFVNAEILDDDDDKCIRFHFSRRNHECDWWVLCPYEKYTDEEPIDYIKINDKQYIGDDLYRLAREILMEKETKILDILDG